jgi:hypothetical protein
LNAARDLLDDLKRDGSADIDAATLTSALPRVPLRVNVPLPFPIVTIIGCPVSVYVAPASAATGTRKPAVEVLKTVDNDGPPPIETATSGVVVPFSNVSGIVSLAIAGWGLPTAVDAGTDPPPPPQAAAQTAARKKTRESVTPAPSGILPLAIPRRFP